MQENYRLFGKFIRIQGNYIEMLEQELESRSIKIQREQGDELKKQMIKILEELAK